MENLGQRLRLQLAGRPAPLLLAHQRTL